MKLILILQNANFHNFSPTVGTQAVRILENLFYIRDPCLLKITSMSLFSDFIKY